MATVTVLEAARMKLRRIGTIHCEVGEGPLWDVLDQALYFVDVTAQLLWRYEPQGGNFTKWKMPSMIGSLALRARRRRHRRAPGWLLPLRFPPQFHLAHLQPAAGQPHAVQRWQGGPAGPLRGGHAVARRPQSRAARAPITSMAATARASSTRACITIGPCWSPEGRTFYFSNSLEKTIFAYDYDPDTGTVSNRRVFADTASLGGMPDGATVDSSGCVWVAVCGGGKIVSYEPDGRTSRVVDVPVPFVSSVMFGGPELGQLYFTSIDGAAVGLTPQRDPLSGGLFVIDGLGVRGLSEPRFAG